MISVVAVTSGADVPSARFRVRQHVPALRTSGIAVKEMAAPLSVHGDNRFADARVPPAVSRALWGAARLSARIPAIVESRRADVTWLERALFPGRPSLERWLQPPIVFDVDDAIWLRAPLGKEQVRRTAQRSRLALAGNSYIAEYLAAWIDDVRVVPTAIDVDRFHPALCREAARPLTVGWTGTASNFAYLQPVIESIANVLDRHSAELLIVADRPPAARGRTPRSVRFERWSPGNEAALVREMDVGLMPLQESEWARGKCAFKLLQYMASGVPYIASPVGMNVDVLDLGGGLAAPTVGSWAEAVDSLLLEEGIRRTLAAEGRTVAESTFSSEVIAPELAKALIDAAQ